MPIYEYQCQKCGMRFERMQHYSDELLRTCPECGGETRRLIQPAGIIFKGSGFYVTDNRRSSTGTQRRQASENLLERSEGKQESDSGGDSDG